MEPVKDITILPWWIVQLGFVTEEDMKLADKAEVGIIHKHILSHGEKFTLLVVPKNLFQTRFNDFNILQHVMVDQIIDNGPCPVGHLSYDTVLVLYLKVRIFHVLIFFPES